ncbi:ion transport peptide-like isoform X1 [Artemia franciscana]|uniref:ion transport peptide-like isoform X1 n=1 Tax=Artemia franciscana TaxID=6661 RepID=UPI0032D9C5EB
MGKYTYEASAIVFTISFLMMISSPPVDGHALGHHLSKRSFFDLQCKGYYDKQIFAKLDRVCYDCYNIFRDPEIHQLCRADCFTTKYFKACKDTLMLAEDDETIKDWLNVIHGHVAF